MEGPYFFVTVPSVYLIKNVSNYFHVNIRIGLKLLSLEHNEKLDSVKIGANFVGSAIIENIAKISKAKN